MCCNEKSEGDDDVVKMRGRVWLTHTRHTPHTTHETSCRQQSRVSESVSDVRRACGGDATDDEMNESRSSLSIFSLT